MKFLRNIAMMRTLITSLGVLLLLTSTAAMSTRLYKWQDERGNWYYGQTKPTEYDYQEVNAPPPPPANSPDLNKPFADQIRGKSGSPSGTSASSSESPESRAAKCQTARTNLQQLLDNPRIRTRNADGTSGIMGEDQRQAKIAESRKQIEYYCN